MSIMLRKNTDDKMMKLREKYRIYCKCGHSIVIFPFERKTKKICSWCGHYVYLNEKIEFKDRLTKLMG